MSRWLSGQLLVMRQNIRATWCGTESSPTECIVHSATLQGWKPLHPVLANMFKVLESSIASRVFCLMVTSNAFSEAYLIRKVSHWLNLLQSQIVFLFIFFLFLFFATLNKEERWRLVGKTGKSSVVLIFIIYIYYFMQKQLGASTAVYYNSYQ